MAAGTVKPAQNYPPYQTPTPGGSDLITSIDRESTALQNLYFNILLKEVLKRCDYNVKKYSLILYLYCTCTRARNNPKLSI